MHLAAVLTDLDGTLLEHGGGLGAEARGAIDELRRRGRPRRARSRARPRSSSASSSRSSTPAASGASRTVRASSDPPGVEVLARRPCRSRRSPSVLEELARAGSPSADSGHRRCSPARSSRRITGLPEERLPAMLARGSASRSSRPQGRGRRSRRRVEALPGLRLTRGGPLLAPLGRPRQGGRARPPPRTRGSSRAPSPGSATLRTTPRSSRAATSPSSSRAVGRASIPLSPRPLPAGRAAPFAGGPRLGRRRARPPRGGDRDAGPPPARSRARSPTRSGGSGRSTSSSGSRRSTTSGRSGTS